MLLNSNSIKYLISKAKGLNFKTSSKYKSKRVLLYDKA